MSKVLSAEEIAQLFAAAKDGELPEAPRSHARDSRSIRELDFSRPMKLSLLEQRRFERAHETFCREAATRLSSEVRSPIELEIINSSQLTWQVTLGNVPKPSILCSARCSPGDATILIGVEEALVLRMVERLLGGSYTDTPAPRSLTPIDTMLVRGIFEGLLATLSSVWQSLLGLSLSLVEIESNDTTGELISPSQPTLELTIEARDQNASSTIMLLVPYSAIETASKGLGNSSNAAHGQAPDEGAFKAMRAALGGVRVEVRAELGAIGLTIGEVLALGTGDVVRLGVAGNACITVGERRLHRALPGLSGNRRAVQIVEPVGGHA